MKPTIVEPAAERAEEDEMSTTVSQTPIAERELEQIERANATTATPVAFVHGLWLLPGSWEDWGGSLQPGRRNVTRGGGHAVEPYAI